MSERTFTAEDYRMMANLLLSAHGGGIDRGQCAAMLHQGAAAHERETALREEVEHQKDCALAAVQNRQAAEAALAEAQREIEKWKAIASENGSNGLAAVNLLTAERQKVTALEKWFAAGGWPFPTDEQLGLTAAQPSTGEPGT